MTRDSDEFMKETIQNHTAEIKRFMQDQDVDAFGIARMADYGKEIVQLDKAFVEKFPFAISFDLYCRGVSWRSLSRRVPMPSTCTITGN